ncbi:hypothetical protein CFOL_v3_22720 [Cephalotus follicularis]|uniref:Uncharacterized protein n=1 Tax=Cephalotus follicularis TaxID=3775 RepID=A0A1Q3CGB4_CEPFO|nr:hypothetical protein CFOL_v3_22720 [Cephalotus follicularis]
MEYRPKRDFRSLWRGRNQRTLTRSNIFEAIAQVSDGGGHVVSHQSNEDGVVRMKIVLKRQDLKQVLEAMEGGKNDAPQPSPTSFVEQCLILLKNKHLLRETRRSFWCLILQTIPEEF